MRSFAATLLAWCALGCARDEPLQRFEFRSRKMATQVRILAYAPSDSVVERAVRAAFARMELIDSRLSDYRLTSEVSQLAAHPAGITSGVSADLATVMKAALALSRETDGAFDVTVGPLTLLWREARRRDTIPDRSSICSAMRSVGWRHVVLDTIARTIRLTTNGMRLDFGGIAKGYAADEALAALRSNGITRAFIEFGGEIAASDPPPGESGWPVSVEGVAQPVMLANSALSTSGDAEQFVDAGGVRYSHVIDPRTGWALTSRAAATVGGRSAMQTDALSTAATVLDSASAAALLRAHPDARLITRTQTGAPSPVAADPCHVLRGRTRPLPR